MAAITAPVLSLRGLVIPLLLLSLTGLVSGEGIAASVPPNDNFADAQVLTGDSGSVFGSNIDATGEPGEPDNAEASEPIQSVWYDWTPSSSGIAVFETCDFRTDFDTTLGAYMGPSVDSLDELASNDDACGSEELASRIEFPVEEGIIVHISVDGFADSVGEFVLDWRIDEPPLPPANDNFDNARVLMGNRGRIRGSNIGATGEPGEPSNAGVSEPIQSAWYAWTPTMNATAIFHTCHEETDFDTTIGAYTGASVDGLTEHESDDDFCGLNRGGGPSAIAFAVQEGTSYHISVDGFGDSIGSFVLSWTICISTTCPEPKSDLSGAELKSGIGGS